MNDSYKLVSSVNFLWTGTLSMRFRFDAGRHLLDTCSTARHLVYTCSTPTGHRKKITVDSVEF
eukprot:COSAG05_NODE_56_length_23335_cov_15.221338_8_plen_63_part_00